MPGASGEANSSVFPAEWIAAPLGPARFAPCNRCRDQGILLWLPIAASTSRAWPASPFPARLFFQETDGRPPASGGSGPCRQGAGPPAPRHEEGPLRAGPGGPCPPQTAARFRPDRRRHHAKTGPAGNRSPMFGRSDASSPDGPPLTMTPRLGNCPGTPPPGGLSWDAPAWGIVPEFLRWRAPLVS